MKIKAIDSFASRETGMVHAGAEFDATDISQSRLDEWAARGFIPKSKKDPAPLNKAETPPLNKSDPLDHDGDGRKGGSKPRKGK